jgi:hypothetical protein
MNARTNNATAKNEPMKSRTLTRHRPLAAHSHRKETAQSPSSFPPRESNTPTSPNTGSATSLRKPKSSRDPRDLMVGKEPARYLVPLLARDNTTLIGRSQRIKSSTKACSTECRARQSTSSLREPNVVPDGRASQRPQRQWPPRTSDGTRRQRPVRQSG